MPINLNPGADPSLVAAAYRAGMHGPPDYSRTFENVAVNYAKTMEANSSMWRTIGVSAMGIYNSVIADANGPQQSPDATSVEGAEGELERIKEAMKRTYGWKDDRKMIDNPGYNPDEAESASNPIQIDNPDYEKRGNPLSKENRKKRAALNKERDDLYANLESSVGNIDAIKAFFEDKKVDVEATGLFGMENNAAMLATRNGKTTDLGNYFVFEKGKDDEWGWTMYHDPSKMSPDAKPIAGLPEHQLPQMVQQEDVTAPYPIMIVDKEGVEQKMRYNANEVKEMLVLNDPKLQVSMEKDLDAFRTLGLGGTPWDDYTANRASGLADKYANSRAAWHTPTWAGEGGKSFFQEANNISGLSADMYGSLKNVLPTDDKGNLLKEGILSKVDEMADGKAGISQEDFQNENNMKALTLALFNPGDGNYDKVETGRVFKKWLTNKLQEVHGYGAGFRKDPSKTGEGLEAYKESEMFEGGSSEVYVSKGQRQTFDFLRTSINNRGSIGKDDNLVSWDDVKESYFHATKGVIPNKESMFETYLGEQLTTKFKTTNQNYLNTLDWDGKKYRKGNEDLAKEGKKVKKITTLGDEEVAKVWFGIAKRDVKKINGVWYVKTGFGANPFTKATASQIKRISKKYK